MLSLLLFDDDDAEVRLLWRARRLSLSLSHSLFSHPFLLARDDGETTETAEMRKRLLNENFLSTRHPTQIPTVF